MKKILSLLSCLLAVQILVGCATDTMDGDFPNRGEMNLNRVAKEGAEPVASISNAELNTRVATQWSKESFEIAKTSGFEQERISTILRMFVVDASFAKYMKPQLTDGCEYFDLVDIQKWGNQQPQASEVIEQWTVRMRSRTEIYKIAFPKNSLKIVRI